MRDYLLDTGKRFKTIKNGKGVQHILDEAYRILGNPIIMHDMEYKLIAYTGNPVTDDPIWNEFITTGTMGHSILEFYREESFLDAMASANKVVFLTSDKLKYNRIFGKIYTKYDIQLGGATIIECDNPFEKDDPNLIEAVCEILTREIRNDEFYQNYGQTYRETLINKLIEGSIKDKGIYAARVADLYNGLGTYLHLVVADVTQCDHETTRLAYFRDLFMRTEPAFKYSIYSNYIVIIMSTDQVTFDAKRDLKKLKRLFTQNNIYAGVRNDTDNLFGLMKYYSDAVSALNNGLKSKGDQRIFVYNTDGEPESEKSDDMTAKP